MRIHGLLCFYDEPVESLVACVTGLHRAGVDSLVAVDGAYALYPDAQAASHPNQHAAITLACRELGMACTLSVPASKWAGGEVEKRGAMFALAWSLADHGDWFWVMDADQAVSCVPSDFKDRLAATEYDAAEVEAFDLPLAQLRRPDYPSRFAVRNLFRAQPITVGPAHYHYVGESGLSLWCGNGSEQPCGALDLTDVVEFEHRPNMRPADRQQAKLAYYAERDASGVERGECYKCGTRAVRLVAARWRMSRLGPVSEWQEACEMCAARLEKVGRVRLRQLGFDPDSVNVQNHNGHAPAGMTS